MIRWPLLAIPPLIFAACGGEGRDAFVTNSAPSPASPTGAFGTNSAPFGTNSAPSPASPTGAFGTNSASEERYERVLREGPITFGLAESRGADAGRLDGYLASVFAAVRTCLADEHREGRTTGGVARFIVVVDRDGREAGHKLTVDSIVRNGHTATLCLEVPVLMRPLPFAPSRAAGGDATRGFAIDLRW